MKNHTGVYGTLATLAGAAFWGLNAVVSKYLMGRGIAIMTVSKNGENTGAD